MLTPENVCELYDKIHGLDESITVRRCIHIMKNYTDVILANGTLMELQDSALCKILAQDELKIECESDLFGPMVDWADRQCVAKNMEVNSINRRDILKNRIYLIRFGAMNSEALRKCLLKVGTAFFSADEVGSIMFSILLPKESKPTINDQRTFSSEHRVFRVALKSQFDCNAVALESSECIGLKNVSDNVSLVGFETLHNYVVDKLFDPARTVEYGFFQSGRRVELTDPLEFSADGVCSFIIRLKCLEDFRMYYLKKVEKSKRVFHKNKPGNTFLNAVYYR